MVLYKFGSVASHAINVSAYSAYVRGHLLSTNAWTECEILGSCKQAML